MLLTGSRKTEFIVEISRNGFIAASNYFSNTDHGKARYYQAVIPQCSKEVQHEEDCGSGCCVDACFSAVVLEGNNENARENAAYRALENVPCQSALVER
jgi:hypothetical protein